MSVGSGATGSRVLLLAHASQQGDLAFGSAQAREEGEEGEEGEDAA